ncbi:MAG TPA: hypothetical protein VN796_10685 [Acidimicrobiales bacterium]|nr:hypothetical protein [Acidimicrobiales bacterium]
MTARPEVLLEAPESVEAGVLWGLLEGSGYKVSWCPGPEGPPPSWCPLLGGHRCALVESSDVVVSALGFHHSSCRQVLAELARLHPEAAVIVETPRSEAVQWEPLLQGHLVLPVPHSERALIEDVEAALSRPVDEDGI